MPETSGAKAQPIHVLAPEDSLLALRREGATPSEIAQKREEIESQSPDFETELKKHLRGRGVSEEFIKEHNLSLMAIEEYQRFAREAQTLWEALRETSNPREKATAFIEYKKRKDKMAEYQSFPGFEKGCLEYINARKEYTGFMRSLRQLTGLEQAVMEPSFTTLSEDARIDERGQAALEQIMGKEGSGTVADAREFLTNLALVYPKDSQEYQAIAGEILSRRGKIPQTKAEMTKEIARLKQEVFEKWQDPMVRYFYKEHTMNKMLGDFAKNCDVLETPDVIHDMNLLHEWEMQHPHTTVGGVLVGPPGVGKTTEVRHYLEEKGRKYAYIDLSEDVTRYMLYGSKAVEFTSPKEFIGKLIADLKNMDDTQFQNFVLEHSATLLNSMGEDEAVVTLISQIDTTLAEAGMSAGALPEGTELSGDLRAQAGEMRAKVQGMAEKAFRREMATEFAHLTKKNGWRDGFLIYCLRNNINPIFDEFVKFKNWSLIYGLITAKPGEKWFFADNNEWIDVPKDWRMYFTANIGRKHGGFTVAEALASRAGGKVLEKGYPEPATEMLISLMSISNPEGDILRSEEDMTKLFRTVFDLFPAVRTFIEGKNQTIPISFRTIRDLGEKLVRYKDPATGRLVYAPTDKTFDQALYEVLIGTYSLYEDKTVPTEIVNLATSVGLFLDDSVKEMVLGKRGSDGVRSGGWISEDTYNQRRTEFEKPENKKSIADIAKRMRGEAESALTLNLPVTKTF